VEKFRLTDLKNFSSLLTGNSISLLIASLGGLFIAKIYGPDSYGLYATIAAGAIALTPVLTLGFEQTLLHIVDEDDAVILSARAILRIVILGSSGALGTLTLSAIPVIKFSPKVMYSISLSFLLAIVLGLFAIGVQLNLRQKSFSKLARRGVVQNLILVSTQGLANPFLINSSGLILGEFIGRISGIIIMFPRNYIKNFWDNACSLRKRSNLRLKVNGWNLISQILDNFTSAFLVLSVAILFGPVSAAIISLSQKVTLLPVSIIGTAFGQLIFANGSMQIRQGIKLDRNDLKVTFFRVTSLGTLSAIATYLLLPKFEIVMGNAWNNSITYAKILCVTIVFQLLWNSFGSLYYAAGKWKNFAILKIVNVFFLLTLVVFCWILRLDVELFLYIYVVISAGIQVYGIFSIRRFFF
jgi:O-antigen/teichoic acid export membrane protein